MTSHLNSHRTTDINPEMLSGVQTGNGTPHDKYNIRGIVHVHTNRKDKIFMQRRLYIDEAHTALDIFRFAVFFCGQLIVWMVGMCKVIFLSWYTIFTFQLFLTLFLNSIVFHIY